jgi:hypothetical protein
MQPSPAIPKEVGVPPSAPGATCPFVSVASCPFCPSNEFPFVAIVGENEMNEGKVMLKNMETGEQNLVSADELIAIVKK